MTDEEVARFALVLGETERIRAQIAEDEAAARTAGGDELPLPATPLAVGHALTPAAAA
jgi:hypothetical protein